MRVTRCATSVRFIHTSKCWGGRVVPYTLADIGEGIQEVEVISLFVKPGDKIHEFEKICEVQSDKATVDITSRYEGVVTNIHISPGGKAHVGQAIVDIEVDDDNANKANADGSGEKGEVAVTASVDCATAGFHGDGVATSTRVLATPATRELARKHGVDIEQVRGSGPGGRVLTEDVLSHAKSCSPAKDSSSENETVVPLDRGVRRLMVNSMTESGRIPSFTACDEVEVTRLLNLRALLKKTLNTNSNKSTEEVKVSLTPLFVKAASLSLALVPELNAHVSPSCDRLFVKKSHNIGLAMDTPNGLLVPVITDVQLKDVVQLVHEVNELVDLGRRNQIPPGRLRGGTFTLSNVGPLGSTYATPLLLPPQVGIGALGCIQQLPRFDENSNVVKANVLFLSWTADHRVIDGATLLRFSNAFKHFLGSPELIAPNIIS
ncbi:putative dihydrolipoamide branched chain transacylase [Trypanosoma vivax]|nr:putative dihydrolipoamide branched chain transacylase [Trypanosoma vivax]